MHNEVVELLKNRRSCRKFQDRQVSEEDLNEILACGLAAPSAKNTQNTKILVIQEKDLIQALSGLNASVWLGTVDPFYGAPTLCLILAPRDSSNGVKDGALVIGAMQAGAYALGVGSCWINRCDLMLELPEGQAYLKQWGLPDYVGVGCCILGYPAEEPKPKTIVEERIVRI